MPWRKPGHFCFHSPIPSEGKKAYPDANSRWLRGCVPATGCAVERSGFLKGTGQLAFLDNTQYVEYDVDI